MEVQDEICAQPHGLSAYRRACGRRFMPGCSPARTAGSLSCALRIPTATGWWTRPARCIYRTLKDTGLTYDEGPDVGGDFGPYIQSRAPGDLSEICRGAWWKKAQPITASAPRSGWTACGKRRQHKGEVAKYDKHCLHLSKEEVQTQPRRRARNTFIRQNIRNRGRNRI